MRSRPLLSNSRCVTLIAVLGGVLAAILIEGCVSEVDNDPGTPRFSHALHVKDEEMECSVCHKTGTTAAKAGMPTAQSCMQCHEAIDAKKSEEHKAQHKQRSDSISDYVVNGHPNWRYVTRISADTKFSHKAHADAKLACNVCHKGIDDSKAVTPDLRVTKPQCLDCHTKMKVSKRDDCAFCHNVIAKTWVPPSHGHNWKELHGRAAAASGNAPLNSSASCKQCHEENMCAACHKVEPPRNHTNQFRLRGHGTLADIDRASCRTCHTEDSCARCHQQVKPRSHVANWSDRHCNSCHFPLKSEGCFACHKNTPSHQAAPRTPTNQTHVKATDNQCRDCHGGLKLRHPDNGGSCLACHRKG